MSRARAGSTAGSGLLPVLVLRHYKENVRKCSLAHLDASEGDVATGRPPIEFRCIRPWRHPERALEVDGGILLDVDAPVLRAEDREVFDLFPGARLIVVDGTWSKVSFIFRNLHLSPAAAAEETGSRRLRRRSVPGLIRTAYPRRSKLFEDPAAGLASVEALVVALDLLGSPAAALLDGYHWKDRFLELNRDFFERTDG